MNEIIWPSKWLFRLNLLSIVLLALLLSFFIANSGFQFAKIQENAFAVTLLSVVPIGLLIFISWRYGLKADSKILNYFSILFASLGAQQIEASFGTLKFHWRGRNWSLILNQGPVWLPYQFYKGGLFCILRSAETPVVNVEFFLPVKMPALFMIPGQPSKEASESLADYFYKLIN
jgi:hypothetical protein